MVQRESGRIRKLRKGCCWKERSVMFLISVLVLLMGIETVLACECKEMEINWQQLMCPYEDKTVIMAGFLNETKVGSSTRYYMVMEKIFKARRHNITFFDNKRFTMVTPVDCRPIYNHTPLEGDTGLDGVLQTSKCNIELYDDEFFNHNDRDELMQIMWGEVKKTCRGYFRDFVKCSKRCKVNKKMLIVNLFGLIAASPFVVSMMKLSS